MTNIDEITLRPALEIQRAHDRVVAIILGEVSAPPGPAQHPAMVHAWAQALCWVLRHDHNKGFGDMLAQMDQHFRRQGVELVDSGKLRMRNGGEESS